MCGFSDGTDGCRCVRAAYRWIDPAGAIAISVILIYLWGGSALRSLRVSLRLPGFPRTLTFARRTGELFVLSGVAAPKEIQQLVIYKAMTVRRRPLLLQVCDACRIIN